MNYVNPIAFRCSNCGSDLFPSRCPKCSPSEDVEKDAARYRWWVKNYGTEHDSPISRKIYVVVPNFKGKLDTKEKFDAAFDSAMLPSRSSESK